MGREENNSLVKLKKYIMEWGIRLASYGQVFEQKAQPHHIGRAVLFQR